MEEEIKLRKVSFDPIKTISAVDWKMVVSSAVVAGVVSLLTSVAGIPEVEADENLNNLFSDGTK